MVVSFRNRLHCLDEASERFLRMLAALGGYCTALQGQELIARSEGQARARLKALERLGFLRRITKYPVVFQVTKSTTRLLERDSGSRRRHTLSVVQARLLGVHFYLCTLPANIPSPPCVKRWSRNAEYGSIVPISKTF